MEVTQVGVKNRARGMAIVAEEAEDNLGAVKRRKLSNEKLRSPSTSPSTPSSSPSPSTTSAFEQSKTIDCEIYPISDFCNASVSIKSGGVPASCCSSSGSMEKLKVADLEVSDSQESLETETSEGYKLIGNESTPESEFKAESGELESCTAQQSPEMINSGSTDLTPEKMPSDVELEAFFAAAEEDLNKRFKDKYNYDIVNDIPLKGRYDWAQLTPGK